MAVMQIGAWTNSIDTTVTALVMQKFAQRETVVDKVFMAEKAQKYNETELQTADFGLFSVKTEGGAYPEDNANEEYTVVYTQVEYGKLYSRSKYLVMFDKQGYTQTLGSKIADSAIQSREQLGMVVFNNGFSTFTAPDAVALFSTSHTRVNGLSSTDANTLSAAADMNITSLQALITVARKTTDARGKYLNLIPATLLLPVELEQAAIELLEPGKMPYTGDNTVNSIVKRAPLNWMSTPYLTDADSWFMLCTQHHAKRKFSQGLAVESQVDFYTDNVVTKASFMEDYGVSDWRGLLGVQGA